MADVSRRAFLSSSLALATTPVWAIDPIVRPGPKPDLKLSLAAYSFRQALDLKKPTMTFFDFIDLAATLPLDAVELTSYYFADTSESYLGKLKGHAASRNLAISGVPVGNNFTTQDSELLKSEIKKVKAWSERAGKLGAKTVRIFAGNLPKGADLATVQKQVIAAIEECCEHAAKFGVMLALENHGGITASLDQMLTLVKGVNSPAFGVNIDTGNFRTADPYADFERIAPYGVVCQIKTEVSPGGKTQEADLPLLIEILKKANFHGYVALEYEAKEPAKVAVPMYVAKLRELIGK
jgi:sugar phosphate isomerase/epimerase